MSWRLLPWRWHFVYAPMPKAPPRFLGHWKIGKLRKMCCSTKARRRVVKPQDRKERERKKKKNGVILLCLIKLLLCGFSFLRSSLKATFARLTLEVCERCRRTSLKTNPVRFVTHGCITGLGILTDRLSRTDSVIPGGIQRFTAVYCPGQASAL